MPIKNWYCQQCKKVVELDHFSATTCGLQLPPDYAAAVLLNSTKERSGVHVTDGLSCPRSRAIERDVGVTVDPLNYNAVVLGSAWDKAMESAAPVDMAKIAVSGEVAGVQLTGEIDRLLKWVGAPPVIADWKHSNNFRQKWIISEGKPSDEYVVQTSLYAELYQQTFGERPVSGVIWHHFSGSPPSLKQPVVALAYDLWDLQRCLDHQPYSGEWTVEELLRQSASYWHESVKALDLPLAGTSMSFGSKSYCDYCQVREACFENAFGAPF